MTNDVEPVEAGARIQDDEAVRFWDQRHQLYDSVRSGGDLTYDEPSNTMFYALRLGRLLDLIGSHNSTSAPLRVLDAGCGKGFFSRAIASFGHRVDGIDVSEVAIAECRCAAVGGDRYAVSQLKDWAPPYLYDVIYSIDVLFHILSDDLWSQSVRNLAALTRAGGMLLLVDHNDPVDIVWGDYQVTRRGSSYRDLLEPLGLRADGFVPNRFRDNAGGFHVFTRVS